MLCDAYTVDVLNIQFPLLIFHQHISSAVKKRVWVAEYFSISGQCDVFDSSFFFSFKLTAILFTGMTQPHHVTRDLHQGENTPAAFQCSTRVTNFPS